MANTENLIDLLIIRGEVVLDEHGLPQLIGGRDVVAQDVGHRLEDSGLVFLLLGDRNPSSIKSLLLKIRLEVENDKRVIPGTVKTSFYTRVEKGILQISAKTNVGDVAIAVPVIPEKYKSLIGDGDVDQELPVNIIFSLPIDLGNADSVVVKVVDLGSADSTADFVVDLGSADLELSTEGLVIYA
jgi:hypothetical protein